MTPTARTLAMVRAEGFEACIVEKWNVFARIRQDAFGFGDVLDYCSLIRFCLYCAAGCILFVRFFA